MISSSKKIIFIALLFLFNQVYAKDISINSKQDISKIFKYSKKISLSFQNVPIKTLFYIIGEHIETNIAVADSVVTNMSINLSNIDIREAFDFILHANNLDYIIYENIMYIAPTEEILINSKKKQDNLDYIQNLMNLELNFYQPKYINAKDLLVAIDNNKKFTSSRGSISVDDVTNKIIILDVAPKIELITNLLSNLDVKTKQILIETQIVKTSSNINQELGIKWSKSDVKQSYINFNSDLGINDPNNFAKISLNKIVKGLMLDLELQALEKEQKLSILANPKLLTLDKKVAVIESGKEIPYITKHRPGADPQVIFKKAALRLEVTPTIKSDNQILLEIKLNRDQPGIQVPGISQAPIDTTHLATQVIAEDSQTIVLGGIFSEKNINTISKVPILGDIPIINYLFRSKQHSVDKSEIVIFVTPRIIE